MLLVTLGLIDTVQAGLILYLSGQIINVKIGANRG